ncbi:MAG TPA: TonB-dependent receptor [Ohtaekwangia sp.]|nr:TonB-dependent receptor [Ohtaekwangia sp.]
MKRSGLKWRVACTFVLMTMRVAAQNDSTGQDLTALSLEDLQNVKIVTASKNQMAAGQAPASVIVVTEEQIRIRGYRSLLDVLIDMPDFKIDDNAYSVSRNTITNRGIEGQQKFVIMLDGVRLSAPANESIPIMENYPVNLAKQIEIIYGPASALYGADAMTGIINIISKKAEYTSFRTEALYATGDNGLHNGTLFTSKKILKDVLLTISGQYFYDGGIDMSRKFKNDTLWDATSLKTGTFNSIYGPMTPKEKIDNEFAMPLQAYNVYVGLSAGNFDFSFFKNYSRNSSAIENTPQNAVYNKDVFYGRGVSVFNARHTKVLDKVSLVSTLTASEYKLDPLSNYRNMYTGMERAYKYGYSSMVRVEEQAEWRLTPRSTLVVGAVFENFYSVPESTDLQAPVEDSRSVEGILMNTPSYYRPEGIEAKIYGVKYYNAGGYTQWQQKVMNKADLTMGMRFDHNNRFGSTINPRMGIVWNPGANLTVKALAATAYLAPTTGSTYATYGAFTTLDSGKTYQSNFFHLPNPNLKPLESSNIELSLRKYYGRNFSTTIVGYYTGVSNLVDFAPDNGNTDLYNGKYLGWNVDYIEVFVNRGRQKVYGGSLQLDYTHSIRRGMIKAYAYLSYVDGTVDIRRTDELGVEKTYDVELDNISNWMLKAGTDITMANWSFSPRLIWLSEQHLAGFLNPEAPLNRQTIDGYALVNMALRYKMGKIHFFGNIMNAFDTESRSVSPTVDLNNTNSGLFRGNYQNPRRFNVGINLVL